VKQKEGKQKEGKQKEGEPMLSGYGHTYTGNLNSSCDIIP
jgi:hypothetical protein